MEAVPLPSEENNTSNPSEQLPNSSETAPVRDPPLSSSETEEQVWKIAQLPDADSSNPLPSNVIPTYDPYPAPNTKPPVESKLADGLIRKQPGHNNHYDTRKPTCTLNIVCYRSSARGCQLQQLQTAKASRFKNELEFQKSRVQLPGLIVNDRQFFETLKKTYLRNMCSFWQRAIFLKSLRGIRLLSITSTTRPTIVPLDDFIIQEILYVYQNPSTIVTDHDWIDWVFRLRQPDRRHALEFVEGWNGTRIAIAGLIPLLISWVLGVVWSWKTGDVQTAFTVAGFVLTAGTLVLALLAIISGIEASGRASTR